MHQFDFRGPVSPTGFQSHFVLGIEAQQGWTTPTDYALAYAEIAVAEFKREQQKATFFGRRSQSNLGATPTDVARATIAEQGQATDKDDSIAIPAGAESSITLALELEPVTRAGVSITEDEVGGSESLAQVVEVLPAVMTEAEARQCIQYILDLGNSLRAKLLDLDLRQGWAVLGYPSMTACIKAEES